MQRTRTTPATFSADFMGMENRSQTYYGKGSSTLALRRELLECVRFVLREERPELTLLGGNIYREMVRQGELTIAEAVAEIWQFVDAEVQTDRWTENDPDIAQAYAELQDFENTHQTEPPIAFQEFRHPHHKEHDALVRCLFAAQRRLAVRLLRQDGEDAIADLVEDHEDVLNLIVESGETQRGTIDREELEAGNYSELRLYSKDGRKIHF